MQATKNLRVSAHARILALCVYRLTTAFPSDERYGLTAQIRRAAVSIGSNIAEGCGRRGNRELLNFLYIAAGSASELAFQLELARDFGYGDPSQYEPTVRELEQLRRMLNRLTQYLRTQPAWRRNEGSSRTKSPQPLQLANQQTD
jgi:four helix bundle protein